MVWIALVKTPTHIAATLLSLSSHWYGLTGCRWWWPTTAGTTAGTTVLCRPPSNWPLAPLAISAFGLAMSPTIARSPSHAAAPSPPPLMLIYSRWIPPMPPYSHRTAITLIRSYWSRLIYTRVCQTWALASFPRLILTAATINFVAFHHYHSTPTTPTQLSLCPYWRCPAATDVSDDHS